MSFTYPERVRRLIDLPERDQWHLALWIYRPGKARRSRRPPRDEPELIERQRTAGHRVRGRLADPYRAAKHPLAGTLLRRAIIENTLDGAKILPLQTCRPTPPRMLVARVKHPGLWYFRDAQDLRQPPARQAWPKSWLLGSGSRVVGKLTLIPRRGPPSVPSLK